MVVLNGYTRKSAVMEVLDQLGDQTNAQVIIDAASELLGDIVPYGSIIAIRLLWRKQKQLETDCRTYDGQPKRNMVSKDTSHACKKLADQLGKMNITTDQVRKLLVDFNSVDDVLNVLDQFDDLQNKMRLFGLAA